MLRMHRLTLTEGASAKPVALTDAEAEALGASELAVISRTPGSSDWLVSAGSKIGVVRIGGLQITIRPKIPISRLVFLMGYAQRPTFWPDLHTFSDLRGRACGLRRRGSWARLGVVGRPE